MKPADALLAWLVMVVWGFNFVVAKVGLAQFPPLFLMVLRFALVSLLVVPFTRVARDKLGRVFLLSVTLGAVHFPLMFYGLRGLDAATAAIAAQLQVPFASLLAALLFKDRLGWRRGLGMIIAFAGIVVIAGEPRLSDDPTALLLVIAAAFAFAVSTILVKSMGPMDGTALNGWFSLFAVPQLALGSLVLEEGQWAALVQADWLGFGAIVYMALGASITAYGLWYHLASRYDVNQTTPYMLTIPVFGVLSGVVALGEPLTLPLIAGGLLTVVGVGIVLIQRPRLAAPGTANPP